MKLISRVGVAGLVATLAAGLGAPAATADRTAPERRAAHKVTLQANKAELVAGHKLVLSGKVKPAAAGTKLVLQKKIGDRKWATEKKLTTTKKGAFSYTDKPNTPGARLYRVVVPKAGQVRAGTSKPVKVTIYRWSKLAFTPARKAESTWTGNVVFIGGTQYGESVQSATGKSAGTADWNLDPSCTTLRARFGAGDEGDEGAVAQVSLSGDGVQLYSRSFTLTRSEARTFDISGVFRLAFSWSSLVGGVEAPGAEAVMATPEVLCAF